MSERIRSISFILSLLLGLHLYAGKDPVDSLKAELNAHQEADSIRLSTLLSLGTHYFSSDPAQGIRYSQMAYDLAVRIGKPHSKAQAKKSIGIGYYYLGNYQEAIRAWKDAEVVYDSLGEKKGVANMLSNIGAVYFNQGDNARALEVYLEGLRVAEEIHDTLRLATLNANIGAVYYDKAATHDKAQKYYREAIVLSETIGDRAALGTSYGNLGEIYMARGELDSALYFFQKSQEYFKGETHEPYPMNNIGKVYAERGEFDKAIYYQNRAYTLAKRMDAKMEMAQSLVALGNTYGMSGQYQKAIDVYMEAEPLVIELKADKELKDIYDGLSHSYAELGNYGQAYQFHTLYANIKDTLYNIETDKKLSSLQFTFDLEKKESQIQLLTKDKELQKAEIQRQRVTKNVTFGGLSLVASFLLVVLFQKSRITKEKQRSEELLLNILPEEIANELKEKGRAEAQLVDEVTILFTDFKDFTKVSEKLSAKELVAEINDCFVPFDLIMAKYGIEKIKTIGDAYMAASGLPVPTGDSACNAILAAMELQLVIEERRRQRERKGLPAFKMRVGIHTGPVVAGIVGVKKFQYDVWGDTVNTAARMESSGEPGKVNISQVTYERIKDDPRFIFTYRGKIEAKNKGMMDMYFVELKSDLHTNSHNPTIAESTTQNPLP
ncbi:MAG: tetratricopeptide repeat protein [Bacteroidota bacterium]|nr:tetratricopeptide repeat protein [Bacteroidota bacterium]